MMDPHGAALTNFPVSILVGHQPKKSKVYPSENEQEAGSYKSEE
jgi:hypothetical protein